MGLLDGVFGLFSFLSSFLGTILIIGVSFFFLEQRVVIPGIIGFLLVTTIILITRTSFAKLRRFRVLARRQGVARSHRRAVSKAMQNRFFSGHIARAFLLGSILVFFEYFISLVLVMIFCALVILSMMRLRRVSLFKTVMSAILGALSGLAGVMLSNFFL